MPRVADDFALDMAPECDGTLFLQQLSQMRRVPMFEVYASTPRRLPPAVARTADTIHASDRLWCYRWHGPAIVQRAEEGVLLFTTADHESVCLPLQQGAAPPGAGVTELILTLL